MRTTSSGTWTFATACWSLTTAGLFFWQGCSVDPYAATRDACIEARDIWVWPDEVPAVVDAVLADPQRFSPDDHLLSDVPVGTVIDDLSELDGCWGWYETEIVEDPQTGQTFEIQIVRVLQFDLAAELVTFTGYTTFPPFDGDDEEDQIVAPEFIADSVAMFVEDWSDLTILDDNSVFAEVIDGWGGAIEADGDVVFDCAVAMVIALNATTSLDYTVTLQGDYLKTFERISDQLDAYDDPGLDGDLWVRMDCPQ